MFRRIARIRFSCSTTVSPCVSYIIHLPSYISLQPSYIKTSLPSSRYRPQRPMYRAFVGREGYRFTLTLPSLFWPIPSLITYHSSLIVMVTGGRREGERISLPWLQPFLHKGLRGVTGGCEGNFEKFFFHASKPSRNTKPVQRY